jgi:hypothetical protein
MSHTVEGNIRALREAGTPPPPPPPPRIDPSITAADPHLAAQNAIDHWTGVAANLDAEVDKYQRLAEEKRQEANKARGNVTIWRNAQNAWAATPHG